MKHNEITAIIIDRALHIHKQLGPGLLESVYHRILAYELRKAGLKVATEVPVPVEWDGHVLEDSFRADIIVESQVLIELKSLEKTAPIHAKQTLTYLKLTGLQIGLLINFGARFLKEGIERIANNFQE